MAKGQKRSGREPKKPKTSKKKATPPVGTASVPPPLHRKG